MQRFILGGLIFVAVQVSAAPPESQSAANVKRQINSCMVRRMGADKMLSYNDAMRACKERVQPAKEALASVAPSDSGTKAH
jgi:hypothetical protein